jgi:hypothetical protein
VEANDRVCFTVFELGRLLPADTALEFSCEYASVVVFGRGYVATAAEEQRRALQLLLDKYFPDKRPGCDYKAITEDDLARTSVFRVDIEEWIGKRKRVEADFPDARVRYTGMETSRPRPNPCGNCYRTLKPRWSWTASHLLQTCKTSARLRFGSWIMATSTLRMQR